MTEMLFAAIMIGSVGLFVGVFLGFASKVFAVKVNQQEKDIREILPGANCGACGYSGCDALAAALVRGEAPANACVVGQEAVANQIKWIIGGKSERVVRNVASAAAATAIIPLTGMIIQVRRPVPRWRLFRRADRSPAPTAASAAETASGCVSTARSP